MRLSNAFLLLFILSFLTISCYEDNDDKVISSNDIKDFVWKGMNLFYLYKANVPDLANDRFSSSEQYRAYLNASQSPEDLFESLIYQRENIDKFSWIVDDYIALEQFFSGISISDGMEFQLFLQPNNNSKVVGFVTLVLKGSYAEIKGIKRGDVFNAIDGIELTTQNYSNLLSRSSYTLNLVNYNDNGTLDTTDDFLTPKNQSISLNKVQYSENPIYEHKIIPANGKNVGYLFYNSFTSDFDSQLNAVFADFKSNNVQELVLDLRYNSGGSVDSALLLSSLITGQFNNEVFLTQQWNNEIQEYFEMNSPDDLKVKFTNNDNGTPLNSLNLNKVYIIALESSASASELVINCLDPYIDVIHIGENTAGKFQASITLYDSEDFSRNGANPNHTYAIQPLILKSLNKVGKTDYFNGLTPDISLPEDYLNLGTIGDKNEKLLAAALTDIENTSSKSVKFNPSNAKTLQSIKISKSFKPFFDVMYVDKKLPPNLINSFPYFSLDY